ncbi:MAG: PaaI family thioesterase [Fastidiosipilaceae bacterium]|jgi:uncharacterized protein (TIGR00369 family)
MRQLNPDHISAVIRTINEGPYFKLLSMKVTELGEGYCKMEVDIDCKHLNPFGALHGGVYASLIDTAAFWAVYGSIPEEDGFITLDLKVDNLSTTDEDKMIVEGKLIKSGRTICFSSATVKTESGKLLAYGTSKMLVTQGLQTIHQAAEAMECPPLPVKFIEK